MECSEAAVRLGFKLALVALVLPALLALPAGFASPSHSLAQATLPSRLSVLHISPDAPSLDVYVDGTRALTGLAFSQASAYIGLLPGSHRIQITPTTRLDVLLATTASFDAGRSYTWVLSGVIVPADLAVPATQDLQFTRFFQLTDNAGPTSDPSARLRVMNASPGAAPLDVLIDGPTSAVLASSIGYGGTSVYMSLPDGSYTVTVREAGSQIPIASFPGLSLLPRSASTIVVSGAVPRVVAANAPNAVHGITLVQLPDQTSTVSQPLSAGCDQVVFNLPAGTAFASVLGYVTDPSLVASIWRLNSALKTLEVGFFQDAGAPVDSPTTQSSPELGFICVSASTSWSPPT